jgi:hypothetical protein
MSPTNPVASDDEGSDDNEDIMPPLVYVGPFEDVSPYTDNMGVNHSNIPNYYGHFPTQNITEGSLFSQQETNIQNRAVPLSQNSVGSPPLSPVLNLVITDGSRMEDIVAIRGHTQDSIEQYFFLRSNNSTAPQAPHRN